MKHHHSDVNRVFRTFFYACWLGWLIALVSAQSRSMTASETGLSRTARVYLNPNTGRFWTADSYAGNNEDPLSLHKYLYCEANPINHIDPSGHDGDIGELMVEEEIEVENAWQKLLKVKESDLNLASG